MTRKRLALAGASVFAVLIALLLIVPSLIDWSKYQSVAKEKVRAATGYDLNIGGEFRIGFLPTPHVSARMVQVTKPGSPASDPFLNLESLNVKLAVLPLLTGRIAVDSVALEKPVVIMSTYRNGTDNWTPVKAPQPDKSMQATPIGSAAQPPEKESAPIAINQFKIKDGRLIVRDEVKGTTQDIGLPELKLKAENLTGPYDMSGRIVYGSTEFKIDADTGGYRKGESFPVQLTAEDKNNHASLKFSGVMMVDRRKEAQGEFTLRVSDLPKLLNELGVAAAVPPVSGDMKLSGMLTASDTRLSITNGSFETGKSKFALKADAANLTTPERSINLVLDTADLLDLDALLKSAEKVADQQKAETKAATESQPKTAKSAAGKPFLPATIKLPGAFTANIQLRAKGLRYRGKETGAATVQGIFAEGKGDGRLTVDNLPGGGEIMANLTLSGQTTTKDEVAQVMTLTNPAVQGMIIGSIDSLKSVFADWLDVVDADVFEKPGMPTQVNTEMDLRVSGGTATVNLKPLSLGETKLNGTVVYTSAARPVVNAKLNGNLITLPMPKAAAPAKGKKEDPKAAEAKPVEKLSEKDFAIELPELPFDLKFDVTMGRVARGDFIISDLTAAGTYDGKGVVLTRGSGQVNGGSVSLTGKVEDMEALKGVDIQAGLKTSDLEGFYKAMTGKALGIQPAIGGFSGAVNAKGDKNRLDTALTANARGFTVQASGVLNDPFSGDLPGNMNIRIRHDNFVEAMRVWSSGYEGSAAAKKPVDISAQIAIGNKVYELKDVKGALGPSDIAGTLKADLSGAKPKITANVKSRTLALGDLTGVESKTPAAASAKGAAATSTTPARSTGRWSSDPIKADWMRSADFDLNLEADTLTYGTWMLNKATLGVDLENGALKISPLKATLYNGTLDATVTASQTTAKAPMNVALDANVSKVDIGGFLSALMASSRQPATGVGSVTVKVQGAGTSSAALMNSLAGNGTLKTETLVVNGIDLDALAANMVKAFGGDWEQVLAGYATQGLTGGKTSFKDVEYAFAVANGVLPVKDFRMETTSGNATMISNGTVSFAGWVMDVNNQIQVTKPKDVPVIGMRLYGPLNAPSKAVNSQALDALVKGKVGDKVKDLVGDKLKDSKAGAVLNQLLGGGQQPAPTPAPVTPESAPVAPAPAEPAAPKTKDEQREEIINDVINQFMR